MKNRKINYRVFVWVGVAFMGLGIAFMLTVNTVVGIALVAAGLGNWAVGVSGRKSKGNS